MDTNDIVEMRLKNFIQGEFGEPGSVWIALEACDCAEQMTEELRDWVHEGFGKAFGIHEKLKGKNNLWILFNSTEINFRFETEDRVDFRLYITACEPSFWDSGSMKGHLYTGLVLGDAHWSNHQHTKKFSLQEIKCTLRVHTWQSAAKPSQVLEMLAKIADFEIAT